MLSLVAGAIYQPWSIDAVNYRFPRTLYWWQAHHWYWTGALDHRLDFSSVGFEWQMLPIFVLTRTDRFLFLLNWFPFLLMPSLCFLAFRALRVGGRSSWRWMWLAPSGYCFALQCSGVQNDGYAVNYILSAIAFASRGFYNKQPAMVWQSFIAGALLTGAKVSNLPLLLPLGVLLLPSLRHIRLGSFKAPAILGIALFCSFGPMTWLCWKHTGNWSGDPSDQAAVKPHGSLGTITANIVILLNDVTQPPFLPKNQAINAHLESFNRSAFINWLKRSNREFQGVHYSALAYEAEAGPGMAIGLYVAILVAVGIFGCRRSQSGRHPPILSEQTILSDPFSAVAKVVPWLAWISYLIFLASLGSYLSARIAAPYYPLLIVPLLRCSSIAAFERRKMAGLFAVFSAATVLPVILLTPVRPLVPIQTIAHATRRLALEKMAEEYRFWNNIPHHLAPLVAHLPPNCSRLGYAGRILDTPYELFKPIGSREILELGLPSGGSPPVAQTNLNYAVVTSNGLEQRYNMNLQTWLAAVRGRVLFQCSVNPALNTHEISAPEIWYLVQFEN
jgi:hypothetical protein